jgi:integrase
LRRARQPGFARPRAAPGKPDRAGVPRPPLENSGARDPQAAAGDHPKLSSLAGRGGAATGEPRRKIRGPKEKRQARNLLTRDHIDALVATQPTLRDQCALLLLVYIGLRMDELRQLRIEHIDLQADTLRVHGKGGHVDPLPLAFEHVRTALELHLRERAPGEYLLYPNTTASGP